jgi:hypothetical protein
MVGTSPHRHAFSKIAAFTAQQMDPIQIAALAHLALIGEQLLADAGCKLKHHGHGMQTLSFVIVGETEASIDQSQRCSTYSLLQARQHLLDGLLGAFRIMHLGGSWPPPDVLLVSKGKYHQLVIQTRRTSAYVNAYATFM